MKAFIDKYRIIIVFITLLIFIVLLILPIATTKRVKVDEEYTSVDDVALYLKKYHELPKNYITQYGMEYLRKHKGSYTNASIIGGDTHINTNQLSFFEINKYVTLKECDIVEGTYYDAYMNRRGEKRLVYTCNQKNVRVFYTDNHYVSYEEITLFDLQLTSNVLWIVFGVYTGCIIALYVIMIMINRKSKTDVLKQTENAEDISD